MDGLSKEVCKRLPLAEAVLRMLHFVCDGDFLADLFERKRGRSYERNITFGTMVSLISDALLKYDGSGHKSFLKAEEGGTLPVTIRAAYKKLAGIPIPLSTAFLCEATARLQELFPQEQLGWRVPDPC